MSVEESFPKGPSRFTLSDVYDRIVVEGGYFDYPSVADQISGLLPEGGRILELCVGSGALAVEMAKRGHPVTGIDTSEDMLQKSLKKVDGLPISVAKADATNFKLPSLFEAVVIHSGHLIVNQADDGSLRLNGLSGSTPEESEAGMRGTVNSAAQHLEPGGRLIMNIERWEDKVIEFQDGSIYVRIIEEENQEFGTRIHVFYDRNRKAPASQKISHEIQIRQPKIPFDLFLLALKNAGFEDPVQHSTSEQDVAIPSLFYAVKNQ